VGAPLNFQKVRTVDSSMARMADSDGQNGAGELFSSFIPAIHTQRVLGWQLGMCRQLLLVQ
jgi:hypothetical protein